MENQIFNSLAVVASAYVVSLEDIIDVLFTGKQDTLVKKMFSNFLRYPK